MTPTKRIAIAVAAVAITVPSVVSVGLLLFIFIPILRDGVQPLTLLMIAADGIPGVFFFTFLVGVPVTVGLTLAVYTGHSVLSRLRDRPPGLTRPWQLLAPGLIGAVLLGALFGALFGPASERSSFPVAIMGPTLLGALAGASAGAVFWRIVAPSTPTAAV